MPDTRYRPAYFVWDNQMGDDEKPCAPFRGFISDDPRDRHAYGETPYLEKAEVDRLIEQGPQDDPEELAWDDNGETLKVWVPTGRGTEATLRTIEPEYIKVCGQDILVWSVSLGWTWIEWEEEAIAAADLAHLKIDNDADNLSAGDGVRKSELIALLEDIPGDPVVTVYAQASQADWYHHISQVQRPGPVDGEGPVTVIINLGRAWDTREF